MKAGREGDDREWDGWMASPTQWTWVWVNSRSWRWTGRPGVLQSAAAAKSLQSCLTLCDPIDPCPWDSPGKNTGVGCHFLLQCMKVKRESEVAQSCPTLSDSTDCSLPGSSVRGIFQARVLEWGATAFYGVAKSRTWLNDWTELNWLTSSALKILSTVYSGSLLLLLKQLFV